MTDNHVLVIPKTHAQFMHQVTDEELAEIGPVMKKIANAIGAAREFLDQFPYIQLDNNKSMRCDGSIEDGFIFLRWVESLLL